MMRAIRDWWRGYSQADVTSVLEKLAIFGGRPGSMVYFTKREMRARQAIHILKPDVFLVRDEDAPR